MKNERRMCLERKLCECMCMYVYSMCMGTYARECDVVVMYEVRCMVYGKGQSKDYNDDDYDEKTSCKENTAVVMIDSVNGMQSMRCGML
eukprot:m.142239 g.142239  ORF g.142239 m.142239 type:complete len:89 (-) comp47887_c0_seq1:35-301(-)